MKDKIILKWFTIGTLCIFLVCFALVTPSMAYYGGYYGGGYYPGSYGGGYYPGSYGGYYGGYGGGYYGGYGGSIYSGMGYAGYGYPGLYGSSEVPTFGPYGYTGVYGQGGFFPLHPGSIPPYSISGDWLKGLYMPYFAGYTQAPGFMTAPLTYTYGQSPNYSNYLGMSILGSRSGIAGLGLNTSLWGGGLFGLGLGGMWW